MRERCLHIFSLFILNWFVFCRSLCVFDYIFFSSSSSILSLLSVQISCILVWYFTVRFREADACMDFLLKWNHGEEWWQNKWENFPKGTLILNIFSLFSSTFSFLFLFFIILFSPSWVDFFWLHQMFTVFDRFALKNIPMEATKTSRNKSSRSVS